MYGLEMVLNEICFPRSICKNFMFQGKLELRLQNAFGQSDCSIYQIALFIKFEYLKNRLTIWGDFLDDGVIP